MVAGKGKKTDSGQKSKKFTLSFEIYKKIGCHGTIQFKATLWTYHASKFDNAQGQLCNDKEYCLKEPLQGQQSSLMKENFRKLDWYFQNKNSAKSKLFLDDNDN